MIKSNNISYTRADCKILSEEKGKRSMIFCKIQTPFGVCISRESHWLEGIAPSIQTALNKTEFYLNKYKAKWGIDLYNLYDFSGVVYVNDKTKIKIIELATGKDAFVMPNKLLSKGVYTFLNNTLEKHLENFKKVHKNRYIYHTNGFEYKTSSTKIKIECKEHGIFLQMIDKHNQGDGCPKCSYINRGLLPISVYLERFAKKYKGAFTYREVNEYIGDKTKLEIKCGNLSHKPFLQSIDCHNQGRGCPECARENRPKISIDFYLNRCKEVHNNKFSYREVNEYRGNKTKLEIKCSNPNHQPFLQSIGSHCMGQGCPQCGREAVSKANRENPTTSWKDSNWRTVAEKSKRFTGFKCYTVKLTDKKTGESFFKIGKTFLDIKRRFKKSNTPYTVSVESITTSTDHKFISNMERKLHNRNRDFKYIPQMVFKGMHECFSQIGRRNLLNN
jgi:hypothetical protein